MQSFMEWNQTLMQFLYTQTVANDITQKIVIFIGQKLDWYVIGVAVLFVVLHTHKIISGTVFDAFRDRVYEAFVLAFTVGSAWFMTLLLKYNIETPRPFLAGTIVPLFTHGGLESFPSGHAAFFMALGVAVFLRHKIAGCLFIFLAILIGICRVSAGVHFPFDVLGGWILGAILAVFCEWLYKRVQSHGKGTYK